MPFCVMGCGKGGSDIVFIRRPSVGKYENVNMISRLSKRLNSALSFLPSYLGHQEILFGRAHKVIVNIERQPHRVRRRGVGGRAPIRLSNMALIFFGSNERSYRQRPVELSLKLACS